MAGKKQAPGFPAQQQPEASEGFDFGKNHPQPETVIDPEVKLPVALVDADRQDNSPPPALPATVAAANGEKPPRKKRNYYQQIGALFRIMEEIPHHKRLAAIKAIMVEFAPLGMSPED
jgi:hypothetical protein